MKRKITCKNPECKQEIKKYKSSKRLYCDDTCKNRAHYIKRIEEEGHLIKMDKAMRRNYKILIHFRDLGLGLIEKQTLISHGFDFYAIHKAEITIDNNGKRAQRYHVYDIYFEMNNNQLLMEN